MNEYKLKLQEANERIKELEEELASLRCKFCDYFLNDKDVYTCNECGVIRCESCYEYAGEWNYDVNCCSDCYRNKYTKCNVCENNLKIEQINTRIYCHHDICNDCMYDDIDMCDDCMNKLHIDHEQSICSNCKELICIPCINLRKETKCPACNTEI